MLKKVKLFRLFFKSPAKHSGTLNYFGEKRFCCNCLLR